MSCGVGHKCSLDPALLWLWHRSAATAPIRSLAWESPHAAEAALEKAKKKKKKRIEEIGHIKLVISRVDLKGKAVLKTDKRDSAGHMLYYRSVQNTLNKDLSTAQGTHGRLSSWDTQNCPWRRRQK